MAILRKLRAFRSLKNQGQSLVLEAFLLPILVSAGFRLVGVPRTQGLLRRWASSGAKCQAVEIDQSVIRAALLAQRIAKRNFGIGGTCLVRSFTLWALLLRRGVKSDLRVGFQRSGETLRGHAWVEYQGKPINETLGVVASYSVFEHPAVFDKWREPDFWGQH